LLSSSLSFLHAVNNRARALPIRNTFFIHYFLKVKE
jgi:hypothetical protein